MGKNRSISLLIIFCSILLGIGIAGCGGDSAQGLQQLKAGEEALGKQDSEKALVAFQAAGKAGLQTETSRKALEKGILDAYLQANKGTYLLLSMSLAAFDELLKNPSEQIVTEATTNLKALEVMSAALARVTPLLDIKEFQEIDGKLVEAVQMFKKANEEVIRLSKSSDKNLQQAAGFFDKASAAYNGLNDLLGKKAKTCGIDLEKVFKDAAGN